MLWFRNSFFLFIFIFSYLNFDKVINLLDKLAYILKLLKIKAYHNLIDDAFHQIIIIVNSNDTSFY